jgi:hypothetical protein
MSNSGSLGTATAEPATMNRVSLGHEEIMDSKGKDRESGSPQRKKTFLGIVEEEFLDKIWA